jgi:phosphohistidine phosphatase SixA
VSSRRPVPGHAGGLVGRSGRPSRAVATGPGGGHMCSSRPDPFRVLIRHADAGSRAAWMGNDEWRNLTDLGQAQAAEAAVRLRHLPVQRILSSPSMRCRQTVVPLARELSLDVEPCWQLGGTVELEHPLRLLSDDETASAVLCTHRETLQLLFAHLAEVEAAPADRVSPMSMAAAWILYGTVGRDVVRLEYLPPVEMGRPASLGPVSRPPRGADGPASGVRSRDAPGRLAIRTRSRATAPGAEAGSASTAAPGSTAAGTARPAERRAGRGERGPAALRAAPGTGRAW